MNIINKSSIVMTCGGCPSQWDDTTDDNRYVLIRVRHGYFSLEIENQTIFDGNPEGIDGVMNTDEMIKYVNETTSKVKII